MRANSAVRRAALRIAAAALGVTLVVAGASAVVAEPRTSVTDGKARIDGIVAEYLSETEKVIQQRNSKARIHPEAANRTLPDPTWAPRVAKEIAAARGTPEDYYRDDMTKVAAIAMELALENRGRCKRSGDDDCGSSGQTTTNVALATKHGSTVTVIKPEAGQTNRQLASKMIHEGHCAQDKKWSQKLFQLPHNGSCENSKILAAYATRDGQPVAPLAPGFFLRQALGIAYAGSESPPTAQPSTTAKPPAMTTAPPQAGDQDSLAKSFKGLKLAGEAGVVITPVGGGGAPIVAGTWEGKDAVWPQGPAWSTMKVPLAVAALRNNGSKSNVTAAITKSDNDAAQALWDALGSASKADDAANKAGDAVDKVLRDGGDPTEVQREKSRRPEFTAFGQTNWEPAKQAKFLAKLPCINKGPEVIAEMGNVVADQRWGLGKLSGARIKGGWGPDTSGKYLVRQVAIVKGSGGDVAVVALAKPGSGTFEAGQEMLNTIGTWLKDNTGQLPGGKC